MQHSLPETRERNEVAETLYEDRGFENPIDLDICYCHQCGGSGGSGEFFKVGETAIVPLRVSRVVRSVQSIGETIGLQAFPGSPLGPILIRNG